MTDPQNRIRTLVVMWLQASAAIFAIVGLFGVLISPSHLKFYTNSMALWSRNVPIPYPTNAHAYLEQTNLATIALGALAALFFKVYQDKYFTNFFPLVIAIYLLIPPFVFAYPIALSAHIALWCLFASVAIDSLDIFAGHLTGRIMLLLYVNNIFSRNKLTVPQKIHYYFKSLANVIHPLLLLFLVLSFEDIKAQELYNINLIITMLCYLPITAMNVVIAQALPIRIAETLQLTFGFTIFLFASSIGTNTPGITTWLTVYQIFAILICTSSIFGLLFAKTLALSSSSSQPTSQASIRRFT